MGLMVAVALTGCGQTGPARTAVKGVVKTADGKVVEGGAITLSPVTTDANAASSPVSAAIKPDGSFQVDGGVVAGKHRVMFEPPQISYDAPAWDGTGAPPKAPVSPYAGMKAKQAEVDIAAGAANDLVVELTPPGA